MGAFVLSFFLLHPLGGRTAGILSVLPVVLLGWLWGFRVGSVAGLLNVPLNLLLLFLTGYLTEDWRVILVRVVLSAAAFTLIGAVVGRLRDLSEIVKGQLAKGEGVEEELRQAHDELEKRVEERTSDLAKANEILLDEITLHVQAEEQIRASLQEKEILLKEIHHRVKNNLQIISSLLNLRTEYIKDEDTLDLFKDSQNQVRSMALIHEKLYQSQDLAHMDFNEYIRSLTNQLFRSYGVNPDAIAAKIQVDDVSLDIDAAIPCGLIINELVTNSLKYAFPDGMEGEIAIDLTTEEEKSTLIVSDNGVGLPKELDFKNTESLGLQIVIMLVKKLKGTIELSNHSGTEFEIVFQKNGRKGVSR